MDQLERLVAESEIRQLASRYAVAIDARDLDTLVGLYVEDVQIGRDQRGHDALRADFDAQLRGVGISILFVGNHVIDFDGKDRASGIVYCKAEVQDGERWIHQAIQYRDAYARTPLGWRFVRRRHLLVYGIEAGDNPLHLEPARWPRHHTGRGELPESLDTWRAFWRSGADPVDRRDDPDESSGAQRPDLAEDEQS